MKIRKLRKLWVRFTMKATRASKAPVLPEPLFIPITAGLRIDLSVPAGAGKGTPVSDLVWVFPTGPSRSVKTLRVRLFSN
jgi:hypothetical protein